MEGTQSGKPLFHTASRIKILTCSAQKDAQLRISEDAGHFLCDFIYYSSLSHLYAHHPGKPRKVLFMHVPADANEQTIPRGVEMALGLIRSIAESEVAASEEGEEGTKKKDENLHI